MRWLYHALRAADLPPRGSSYAPPGLAREGFVHASYRDDVAASAALYLPRGEPLALLRVDPRRLGVAVERASTPRGAMPHILGPIPGDAWVEIGWDDLARGPDRVEGTRFGIVAPRGASDAEIHSVRGPLERLAAVTRGATGSVVELDVGGPSLPNVEVLGGLDALVLVGGSGVEDLARDERALQWLASFPSTRMRAAVGAGGLVLAALERASAGVAEGARSHTQIPADDGEELVVSASRVVGKGAEAGRAVALALVRWVAGDEAAVVVARAR